MLFNLLILSLYICASTVEAQTPTTTLSSIQTDSPQFRSDLEFQNQILKSTNYYRAQHNATAFTWNTLLAHYALIYANSCLFKLSVRPYFRAILARLRCS